MRSPDGDSCIRFRLGEQAFGLPLAQVREIATAGRIAPVPLAPPVIRGLASLRGRVVTLIDVAAVYGRLLPPPRAASDELALLLCEPWRHLALYVHAPVEIGQPGQRPKGGERRDHAPATAAVEEGASDAPAPTLVIIGGDLVHVLSASDLVAFCEARVVKGFRRKTVGELS